MRIDAPPISALPGFVLRQLERSDLADWYAYLSLREVFEHTSWNVQSVRDLESVLERCESPDSDSICRLAIIDETANRLVGTIGFHFVSSINRSAELAYDYSPDYWGRGIATVMCTTVTQWCYQVHKLIRVQATVLETNLPSERVLQKCGFSYEGLLRAYRMVRGSPGNFKMYSRLASDHP